MKKAAYMLNYILLIAILIGCWGDLVVCFVLGNDEFWIAILVIAIACTALCFAAYLTRFRWMYAIASAAITVGAIVFIAAYSYAMYFSFVLGPLTIVAEIVWLVLYLLEKKKEKKQ